MRKLIILISLLIISFGSIAQKYDTFGWVNVDSSLTSRSDQDTLIQPSDVEGQYKFQNMADPVEDTDGVNFRTLNANLFTQPVDSLTLNPNIVSPSVLSSYTLKADSLTGLIAFSGEFGGVSYINATNVIPFINNTGETILKGTPLSSDLIAFASNGRGLPTVEFTICTDIESARTFQGLASTDVLDGSIGLIFRQNFLTGFDTSPYLAGDPVYVDCDTSLTKTAPSPPDYVMLVGRVIVSDAVNGVIAVTAEPYTGNDTNVNISGILNGIITQKQAIRDTLIGGVVYFETYNTENPDRDLPFMSNGVRYELNTTTNTGTNGYARVALSFGTEISPVTNYVYIDNTTTPTLTVNTTAYPDDAIRVCEINLADLTSYNSYGLNSIQRFNNAVDGSVADGWVSKAAKRIRLEGSKYESGVDPTITIVTDGTSKDSFNITTTSGIIWQFNRQTYMAQEEKKYLWLNSPTGERWINDLNEIDSTATGIYLHGGTNRRYGLNIFGIQNSGDFHDHLGVTVSTDYYSTDQNAIDDVNGYAVTNVPAKYSKVAVRLFRLVVNYSTTSNGTITNLISGNGFQDERGFPLGTTGSGTGSSGSQVNFPDNQFTVFDNSDPTKIVNFQVDNVTTGTTITLTIPDKSDTIAVLGDIPNTEYVTLTGTTPTFTISNNLNAKITLSGNTTITLSGANSGDEGNIIINNPSTYTLTISPTPYVINSGGGSITLSTGITILSYTYDGTSYYITFGENYTNS